MSGRRTRIGAGLSWPVVRGALAEAMGEGFAAAIEERRVSACVAPKAIINFDATTDQTAKKRTRGSFELPTPIHGEERFDRPGIAREGRG